MGDTIEISAVGSTQSAIQLNVVADGTSVTVGDNKDVALCSTGFINGTVDNYWFSATSSISGCC